MKKIFAIVLLALAVPTLATVSSTSSRIEYTGNGSTKIFAFTFPVASSADVSVYLSGAKQGSGYSVSINANQNVSPGGSVTFTVAPALNFAVRVQREEPMVQGTALTAYSQFPAKVIEKSIDATVRQVQQVDRRIADAEATHASDKATQSARDDSQDALLLARDAAQDAATATQIAMARGANPYQATSDNSTVLATGTTTARTLRDLMADTINVKSFNAVCNGSTDDYANLSSMVSSLGSKSVTLVVSGPCKVGTNLTIPSNLPVWFEGNGAFVGAGIVTHVSAADAVRPTMESASASAGIANNSSSLLILGDSITAGSGASAATNAYAWLVGRSIMNAADHGFPNERGFGWHSTIAASWFGSEQGVSNNGAIIGTGVVGSRLSLGPGKAITITQRAIAYADITYDASASTGSIVIALNGTTISTIPVTGTGLKFTGYTQLKGGNLISESDTVTITSGAGTVVVTSLSTVRQGIVTPIVYVAGQSGTAYQDFTSTTALDELAYYLNLGRSGNGKRVVLGLGTNNIYNPGKALSPSAMITQMDTVITGLNSRCSSVTYIISVPPRAVEGTWPVVLGYTHQDYANAIIAYARSHGHATVRYDRTLLVPANSAYYSDGLHPTDKGHLAMATALCDALGIPLNGYLKTALTTVGFPAEVNRSVTVAIPMNSTWRAFLNTPAIGGMVTLLNGVVHLSGLVEPNGSVSTTVGTLPAGYAPIGRDVYQTVRTDSASIQIKIDASGNVILSAVPASWLSLEGVSYILSRN